MPPPTSKTQISTPGKRTPIMPYINRSFYENEFNRPAKYYFLIAALRTGFNVYDVKPEFNDISITNRVIRANRQNLNCVVTYAYNAIGNDLAFNNTNGYLIFYSNENRSYAYFFCGVRIILFMLKIIVFSLNIPYRKVFFHTLQ